MYYSPAMHLLEPVEEASDSDDIPVLGDFAVPVGNAWATEGNSGGSSTLEMEQSAGLAFAFGGTAFGGLADTGTVWTPAGSQESWFPAPSRQKAPAEEDPEPGPTSCEDELATASIFHSASEVALGDTVHYWSASKQNWLPGRFLGADPRGRLLVDKQNQGCICALIPSDVMTKADKADRVLRLLDALERDQE
jgi:hypothetical protein